MITVGEFNTLISKIKKFEMSKGRADDCKLAIMNCISSALLGLNENNLVEESRSTSLALIKQTSKNMILNLACLCNYLNVRIKLDTGVMELASEDIYTTIFNFYDVVLSIDTSDEHKFEKENAISIYNIFIWFVKILEANNLEITFNEVVEILTIISEE